MDILSSVLPVFLVILCGYFLRRHGFITESFVKTANGLIYYFLLPVLLFYKIGTARFDVAFSPGLIAGSYAATILTFFLAYLTGTTLKLSPPLKGAFVQGSFRANLAYVGLPIVLHAVGDSALRKAAVLLGFMVPLLNFLAIVALLFPQRGTEDRNGKGFLRELATNPLIISSFLGIGWSYLNLEIPLIFARTMEVLSNATLPLALLCLGGSFSFKISKDRYLLAVIATILKNMILPTIAIAIFRAIGLSGDDLLTGVIMTSVPTAVITYVFAYQLKGDSLLASTIVVTSTVTSVITISLWMFLVSYLKWV